MRITILICGKASSGKTTFATILEEEINKLKERAKVIHNAQAVKTLAHSFFHWDKEKNAIGRQLLIDITNAGYGYDANFWEKETERFFRNYSNFCNEDIEILIVPDWRYMCTYDFFSNCGKVIPIHVERRKDISIGTHSSHSSENNFKDFPMKYHVLNDGTIEDLRCFARMIMEVEGLYHV